MGKIDIEKTKLFNDYIKHLNTLSTGSILLLVTFLEKIFSNPLDKWLVAMSLICFLSSVIGGVAVKTILTLMAYQNVEDNEIHPFILSISYYGTYLLWIGFLLGIISLAVFGIINL
ncbi:MAG: hypothetical protein JNJ52_01280 [Flavobacterium sp.]|nr:hypothetical protein [Flavobacterium sp.]